jgi:transcriptional regulator with XRE-family HTH domain
MVTKQKINRIMGMTGWTREKLARLMGVSGRSIWAWSKGQAVRLPEHAERLDWLYGELVEPFVCEIEARADAVEKKLLQDKIKNLADDNICKE